MTEENSDKSIQLKRFGSEPERVRALAGKDVPRYPDGRPMYFLNLTTPLSFDQYKRFCKDQRKMGRQSQTHLMQWPKKGKSDSKFVFGRSGGE